MPVISRQGGVYQRIRKSSAAFGYVVRTAADSDVTTDPTINAGTGAPTEVQPNGSLWMRTDAPDADNALYMRIGAAWVVLAGATP